MRRRPKRLEVSTFPFLAVLLCAMGSLILLLLVLDRRAKVVALAKAREAAALAVTRAEEEDAEVRARRAAEWERRRQALHQSLVEQEKELLGQMEAVEAE